MKNAFAVLLCSRGAAMFLSGDEFANTQQGNNNAYCQDNEISWLDWSRLETHSGLWAFVRRMIAFRKAHPVVRGRTAPVSWGWPEESVHSGLAWNGQMDGETRLIGVMFAGRLESGQDDAVFLAVNAHWEAHRQELPCPPAGWAWHLVLHTACPEAFAPDTPIDGRGLELGARSAAVLVLRPQ